MEKINKSADKNSDKETFKLAQILGKHCKRESLNNVFKRREIKRKTILKFLIKNNIQNKLKKEKTIYIILDNYSVHKSQFIKQISKILNIKLIPLPTYSLHLNPIEQVWRIEKRIIKKHFIKSTEFLTEMVSKEFYKIVKNYSIVEKWFNTFITKVW